MPTAEEQGIWEDDCQWLRRGLAVVAAWDDERISAFLAEIRVELEACPRLFLHKDPVCHFVGAIMPKYEAARSMGIEPNAVNLELRRAIMTGREIGQSRASISYDWESAGARIAKVLDNHGLML